MSSRYSGPNFFGSPADGAVIRTRDRMAVEAAAKEAAKRPETVVEQTINHNVERHRRELAEQKAREDAQFADQNRRHQEQIDRVAAAKALEEKRKRFHEQERSLAALYTVQGVTPETQSIINEQMVVAGTFGDLNAHFNALQAWRWNPEGK